jgi:leucyl aminopeptidase
VTSYHLRSASPAKTRSDVVVVGAVQSGRQSGDVRLAPGAEDVTEAFGRKLRPLLSTLGFAGKPGEVAKVPTAGVIGSPMLVIVGLGDDPGHVAVRRAAGAASRAISNASSVALALPADTPELVRAVTEGFELGGYTFTTYKRQRSSQDGAKGASTVSLLTPIARQVGAVAAMEEALVVAQAVRETRDWVNLPAADLRPPDFSDAVVAAGKKLGRGTKVSMKVFDEVRLAELGCGGILGVGGGSSAPPRMVELTYAPAGAVAHLALVGKGITYDSGGLSIKPATGMTTMKCDMAGAAAVVQATFAIAKLGLPIKVSTFAPMAENMVSGSAMRPGDVITQYGGTTVEVMNTDAEGRLILADALVRATELKPDVILDVATLTGHMVIALGERLAGVLGSDEIVGGVLAAAESAGEAMWPMPIPDAIVDRTKASKIADLLQHDGIRWGGGLFAAAYLREFTAGLPWAHLDIAGPAFNTGGAYGHVTAGGTGFAVTTLVDYAKSLVGPSMAT